MDRKIIYVLSFFIVLFSPEAYSQLEYVLNDSEIWLGDDHAGRRTTWRKYFNVIEEIQENPELSVEAHHVNYGNQPVYLNDQLLGQLPASYPYRTTRFSIPDGLLNRGSNKVKIKTTYTTAGGWDDITLRRVVVSYGANHYWTNSNGGIWANPVNWNHDIPPAAGDATIFDINNGYIVSSAVATVKSVNINAGFVEFDGGTDLILGGAPSAISLDVNGSQMILSGGAEVLVTDTTLIGNNRRAKIIVRNDTSELDTTRLTVGWDAFGQLDITDAGNVTCSILAVRSLSPLGAVVSVTGPGSSLYCTIAYIGHAIGSTGDLYVDTGGYINIPEVSLTLGSVVVGAGGLLDVDEIVVHGGLLAAHGGGIVTNIGGTVPPGFSPGVATINGDYTQESGGTLEIEIGGVIPGDEHDVLNVTGNVTLGGKLNINFINGYAPKEGDFFEFLQIGGAGTESFSDVTVRGLENGFEYDVSMDGGITSLTALNDGIPLYPWPIFMPAITGMGR